MRSPWRLALAEKGFSSWIKPIREGGQRKTSKGRVLLGTRDLSQSRKPSVGGGGNPAPRTYPVGVKELDGPQDVKLAGHKELDCHVPGERGHIVLACPLVDLLQELLGGLQERGGGKQ